jgi:hypothetical protein
VLDQSYLNLNHPRRNLDDLSPTLIGDVINPTSDTLDSTFEKSRANSQCERQIRQQGCAEYSKDEKMKNSQL